MEPAEMRRRVEDARVAYLATLSPDGRPHLVPCTFALAGREGGDGGGGSDVTVYSAVDAKPKATPELARLRNLEADPRATLLVDHYEDDWDRLWWVRLRGRGRVLRDGTEREHALDLLAARYPPYREHRPEGPVVALDVDEWRGWAASSDPGS